MSSTDKECSDLMEDFNEFRRDIHKRAAELARNPVALPVFREELRKVQLYGGYSLSNPGVGDDAEMSLPGIPANLPVLPSKQRCCLAQKQGTGWARCTRPICRRLTRGLQEQCTSKLIPIGRDQKVRHDGICVFHWRIIKYTRRGQKLNDAICSAWEKPESNMEKIEYDWEDKRPVEEANKSKAKRGRGGKKSKPTKTADQDDDESIPSSIDTDDLLSDEDDITASDGETDRGSESGKPEVDQLKTDGSERDDNSDTEGGSTVSYSEEFCVNRDYPGLHLVEIDYNEADSVRDPFDWRDGSPLEAVIRGEEDNDEEEEEEGEEGQEPDVKEPQVTGLHTLSAATLRKYRKFFKIPTKASASKHVMLEGVEAHFRTLPDDCKDSIARFLHACSTRKA